MSAKRKVAVDESREFEHGTPNTVLHIDDVHKSFSGLHALSDVDLDVRQGETHAIIGPNGAGKSTLLNICVGRLKPDRGAVVFDGEILTGKSPHEINQLGVARVFQTPEVFPDLTILENVMVPALSKRDGHFSFNLLKVLVLKKLCARVQKKCWRMWDFRHNIPTWLRPCHAAINGVWNWPWD